jgi:uncharacterized protein YneF (UPF0154 family)
METKRLRLMIRWTSIALALALFGIVAQAQEPLLTLTLGSAYDLQADGDKFVVRAPITLGKDVAAGDLKPPTKTDLEFNQVHNAALLTAFEVEIQPATDTLGPALIITVDMTKVVEQGAYILRLRVEGKAGKSQLLDLKLTRPTAKLRPPGTLVVEQVRPLIWGDLESVGQDVLLREVSGRSRISQVSITQLTVSAASGQQTRESIKFARNQDPNKQDFFNYTLTGPFPLGSTTGTAEIVSPQLAEPVPLTFQVKARRSRWLIVVFLLLGFIAGYFLRTKLQQQIALDEARLKGRELQKTISDVQRKHKDQIFKEKLGQVLTDLESALNKRQLSDLLNPKKMVDDLNTATATAKTNFEAAQADLKTRRDASLAAFQELLSLTQVHWSMPESVKSEMKSFDVPLQEIRQQLDASNVAAAVAGLQVINSGLAAKVYPLIEKWRNGLTAYLDILSSTDALPAPVRVKLTMAVGTLSLTLGAVQPDPSNTTTASLKALFTALDKSYRGATKLMDDLELWLNSSAKDVIAGLQQQKVQDPAALTLLAKAVEEATSKFVAGVTDPQKEAGQLSQNLQKLEQAFRAAVEKQIPAGATDAELLAITQALDGHLYLEAARAVVQIIIRLKPVKPSEGTALGTAPHAIAPALAPELMLKEWSLPEGLSMGMTSWLMLGPRDHSLPPIDKAIVRTWRSLILERLLRSLLVGVGITVVGFFLYYDSFVGTPKELAAMFFWAFGLDISVEALIKTAPNLK